MLGCGGGLTIRSFSKNILINLYAVPKKKVTENKQWAITGDSVIQDPWVFLEACGGTE